MRWAVGHESLEFRKKSLELEKFGDHQCVDAARALWLEELILGAHCQGTVKGETFASWERSAKAGGGVLLLLLLLHSVLTLRRTPSCQGL